MFIPSILLKQLYNRGSLTLHGSGVRFSLKNRLKDALVHEVLDIRIDDKPIASGKIRLQLADGQCLPLSEFNSMGTHDFPLRASLSVFVDDFTPVAQQKHRIHVSFRALPFGVLTFEVDDVATEEEANPNKIPRSDSDDYGEDIIKQRQRFYAEFSGAGIEHIAKFSIDPQSLRGNIENFIGVAQVPIGIAGPFHIQGEHAHGEFMIPLATTEGTLVASYNRGMKLLNMSGGVKSTVVDDAMQRAPVFVFEDARGARDFVQWVKEHMDSIRHEAEATSSVAKLTYIDHFLSNKFAFLRFNFRTGDAAGQNMVGRATFAACGWILDHYPGIQNFYLESNFATDKKASHINIMRTRGKRVTSEVTIKREHLLEVMRVDPKQIDYHGRVAGVGSFLSGVNNTGLHSPNGITAMFIATGQDVANVSESSAGILYSELTDDGDLYLSLTIPSLIVATHGGGTGIGTQRECLELLGCYGRDRVYKLAEIIGAVALAGEISLASAISSSDWVSSHEQYGRNR
ncbi:hydroxymethylglutaryl-CoA reductase [Bowmanella pacifica]|uniref:hydroxymethylglutaryl-CoA reductase (NADPH) n=1 Tax=Bowmanella pacifica TaxID=502051 RepID=A0A917Z451_9ALTE|nr:hydroxymethylglutaryl-CoA reductase [Bowmanella pacifica]GGO73446.1 hydroxymethylglutaryl-CoA reductase [Bowmanella pacifica]